MIDKILYFCGVNRPQNISKYIPLGLNFRDNTNLLDAEIIFFGFQQALGCNYRNNVFTYQAQDIEPLKNDFDRRKREFQTVTDL